MSPAEPGRRVLARRGVGGYRQYRIPALCATATATLCAFDGRHDFDDLPAPIDLLVRRSLDSGDTWSPAVAVRAGDGFQGFGDPSFVVDPVTGHVFCFHSATERAGFFESGDGEDPADPDLQHCDVSISTDDGLTWRHERLTAPLRRTGNAHLARLGTGRIAGIFAAAGAGCAITAGPHAGRLVQPYVLRIDGRIDVACALSDDHGGSWRLGRPVLAGLAGGRDPQAPDLNESSVCALEDGSLLLHSRGTGRRLQARSDDGGETFGPVTVAEDLPDSGTNGSVIAGPVAGEVYASHTADPQLRRLARISRSADGGRTWRPAALLEPGSAGYTCLAALPDGRIGVIYEADGYQELRFEAFDPADLAAVAGTGEPDEAEESAGWMRTAVPGGLVLDLVLRSIVPARPSTWGSEEPVHTIDLSAFADVGDRVFKEIGGDRAGGTLQVLRTRAALAAHLGPVRPGLAAGDVLTVHARLRNDGAEPITLAWDGERRGLAPGEAWVRRDLTHHVTAADLREGAAVVHTRVDLDRPAPAERMPRPFQAALRVPAARVPRPR